MKLKKGDNIIVISGSDKGKTGTISSVNKESSSVLIEGINLKKRHYKKSQTRRNSGIEKKPFPILASKVGILRPGSKDKASRIGFKVDKEGNKKRVYRQAANKEIK